MKCIACNRPIFTSPTATIASRGGPLHYGPVCARRAGLTVTAAKRGMRLFTPTPRRRRSDETQLDLFRQDEALPA